MSPAWDTIFSVEWNWRSSPGVARKPCQPVWIASCPFMVGMPWGMRYASSVYMVMIVLLSRAATAVRYSLFMLSTAAMATPGSGAEAALDCVFCDMPEQPPTAAINANGNSQRISRVRIGTLLEVHTPPSGAEPRREPTACD